MSGFLLDTNIISASSPHARVDDGFERWLHAQSASNKLFLSAVTIHEISKGISLLKSKNATAKSKRLAAWRETLLSHFRDRLLPFDVATAVIAGELEAHATSMGGSPGMADAMIAATAKLHDLTVVIWNIRHFRMFEVDVLSPADVSF